MRKLILAACLATTPAAAAEYVSKDALICFTREAFDELMVAFANQDMKHANAIKACGNMKDGLKVSPIKEMNRLFVEARIWTEVNGRIESMKVYVDKRGIVLREDGGH